MYTEEEQLEALQLWWQRWKWVVLGSVAVASLSALGYIGWETRRTSQLERAFQAYDEVLQSLQTVEQMRELQRQRALEALAQPADADLPTAADDAAQAVLWRQQEMQALQQALARSEQMMQRSPSSGYSWLAALQTAALAAGSEEPSAGAAALELMRLAAEATDQLFSGDDIMHGLIRLHYARMLAGAGQAEQALQVLEDERVRAYGLLYHDLKGDLLAQQGDLVAARLSWQNAQSEDLPPLMQTLLEIKANSWSLLDKSVSLGPVSLGEDADEPSQAEAAEADDK